MLHDSLGKCNKKYSITSLPISNTEGGIEAETWVQRILIISTITQNVKKYCIFENKRRKIVPK